jgi:large subunit ribosomal protein L21
MYAVIESGGKQYRVELGTELEVPRVSAAAGTTIDLDRVLLVAGEDEPAVGRPLVEGARVTADVVRHLRGEKIVVFKYRPKARHRSKAGARADLTLLRISDIRHGDLSAAKLAESSRTERERLEAAAAEAAARQAEADRALAAKLARDAASAAAPKEAGPAASASKPGRTRRGSGPKKSAAGESPSKAGGASKPPTSRPRKSADRTQAPGAEDKPAPRRRTAKKDQ